MDIKTALKQRRLMRQKAKDTKQEQKRKSRIHWVPTTALVVANLLVLSLDYRVVEAIYKITGNVALAVFALFTSGAMFILWFDVLYQYLLSNETQKNIALAFSGLSLLSAGFFAFLDYGLSAGYGVDQVLPMEANLLFAGMVVLTIANGIGLFVWYIYDEQVQRKSIVERNRADNDFDAETLEDANKMLEKAGVVLQRKQAMESRFGKEAVEEMMSMLAGLEDALGVDLDGDGRIGNRPQAPQTRPSASFASNTHDELGEAEIKPKNPQTGQGQQ